MKPATRLALAAAETMGTAHPRGEIDWRAVHAKVFQDLPFDADAAKHAQVRAGVDSAKKILNERLTAQLPLAGMDVSRDAFLVFAENMSVWAPRAKLGHILGATQIRQTNFDQVAQEFSLWQRATLPLYQYWAQGMDWDGAAAAYRQANPPPPPAQPNPPTLPQTPPGWTAT